MSKAFEVKVMQKISQVRHAWHPQATQVVEPANPARQYRRPSSQLQDPAPDWLLEDPYPLAERSGY